MGTLNILKIGKKRELIKEIKLKDDADLDSIQKIVSSQLNKQIDCYQLEEKTWAEKLFVFIILVSGLVLIAASLYFFDIYSTNTANVIKPVPTVDVAKPSPTVDVAKPSPTVDVAKPVFNTNNNVLQNDFNIGVTLLFCGVLIEVLALVIFYFLFIRSNYLDFIQDQIEICHRVLLANNVYKQMKGESNAGGGESAKAVSQDELKKAQLLLIKAFLDSDPKDEKGDDDKKNDSFKVEIQNSKSVNKSEDEKGDDDKKNDLSKVINPNLQLANKPAGGKK